MSKGQTYKSESVYYTDEKTGTKIRQVTDHKSVHHHPFFYIPAYDDRMQWLFFISHRSGAPQIFTEERSTKTLVQLTDRTDIAEWSIVPSGDGRYVYFTTLDGAWRLSLDTLTEEELAHFDTSNLRERGMVGAAMGTTTLSADGLWWVVPVKIGEVSQMVVIDTANGSTEIILERDTIGHPQFHPDNSNLLRYAGPYHDRIWIIERSGSGNRLAYKRDVSRKEWAVHEFWIPRTNEIAFTDWPHRLKKVDVDTGQVKEIASFNAWHPICSRDGKMAVSDTTYPDIGLQIFSLNEPSDRKALCYPQSSNMGRHWKTGHCPYDDGPTKVYAPQHTHPHPSFSPDGRYVVYTSDVTGWSQVYEVEL